MRHKTYGGGDDQPILVGDVGWRGVDLRREPHQLEEGLGSWAVNTRFTSGVPETRLGTAVLNWTMKLVAGEVVPFATIYGVGVFRDPITQRVYQITATSDGVWAATEGNPPGAVPMPSGVTITDRVSFTQCFNVLVMFRGRSLAPLQMASVNLGFTNIPQTEAGSGTLPIPKGEFGLFFSNRLIVPFGNDEVAVSDFQDYTRYEPTRNAGKINQGSADRLIIAVKFNDTTVVAFKGHSVFAIYNVFGDLSTMQLDEITREFGLVAPRSIAQIGNDLWFLSELGVMSVTQTEQNKLQGVVMPVSAPIDPLIRRINWRYAHNATSAYNDNRYYLAVPVDAAEILHDEALPPGANYRSDGSYPLPLVPGASYRLVIESADEEAVDRNDGFTSIFYTKSGDITLVWPSLDLSGPAGAPVTISVRRVVKGVNNMLLVYDFLNQAWSGYDETPELDYKELFVMPYARKERLFVATSTGHIFLYEEHVDDAMVFPYTEVRAASLPDVGDTIEVNDGKLVTAAADDFNGVASWGIGSPPDLALARTNLWSDPGALGGFSTGTAGFWDYGGAAAYPVAEGVRFRSLDGKQPKVVTTGTWAEVTVQGRREIATWFITSGKSGPNGSLWRPHWLQLDVQTQRPSYSVNVLTEGVGESNAVVTDSTRSRTRYQEHGLAEWDPTNLNDDFMAQGREDYSVMPGAAGIYLHDGVRTDLHQESRQQKQVGVIVGRAPRIEVRNTQGRLRLLGASLEGVPVNPGEGIFLC